MVDYKTLEKIAKKLEKFQDSPFSSIGLKADLRYEDPTDLTSLMIRHEGEELEGYAERVLLEIGKTMTSDENLNKRIAIVGPQGSGKTTLLQEIFQTLRDPKHRAQFNFLRKVQCFSPIQLKMLIDKKFDFLANLERDINSNLVLSLDDCQELFYPEDEELIKKDAFESLNRKLNSLNKSVFLFSFNAFGWKIASTKIPDISNYFEKIIWVDGLKEQELVEVIKKRVEHFSIDENKKVAIEDLFEDEFLLKEIVRNSSRNPRLTIALVSQCIIKAHENKKKKIDSATLSQVLEDEGITQLKILPIEDLIKNNKTIYSLLARNFMSIKMISQFSGLNRTTINKELESTVNKPRLNSMKNPLNKKEKIYGLKKIIRAALEQVLMNKLEKKVESIKSWSSDQMKV